MNEPNGLQSAMAASFIKTVSPWILRSVREGMEIERDIILEMAKKHKTIKSLTAAIRKQFGGQP